jgi:hypothetical protein
VDPVWIRARSLTLRGVLVAVLVRGARRRLDRGSIGERGGGARGERRLVPGKCRRPAALRTVLPVIGPATYVTPAGSTPATRTAVAVAGPAFVTVSV